MKQHRETPEDRLAERTRLEHVHQNSVVIASQMRVLQCEAEELMKSEEMLAATLSATRTRRKSVDAKLAGLKAVLAAR